MFNVGQIQHWTDCQIGIDFAADDFRDVSNTSRQSFDSLTANIFSGVGYQSRILGQTDRQTLV
jgi:hypothetical protein